MTLSDAVRQVAREFNLPENKVWEYLQKSN